ncbi:MAG: phenylalanine--tRNA ligase subunit beta [Deltaproteobacteria bacterium]|nr:phenylalanine--tRNA ligase subunit beta [Deltaproteobacteria bacterium]
MKVSLNWIREYVNVEMGPDELCHLLTMTGLEVEGMEPVGQSLEDIIVGRIVSVKPHPRSERLTVCAVDTGQEQVDVVCGAPNVVEGALAPLILPGGKLPDGRLIEKTRIREVLSTGMLLAEDEMGVTDDHAGIMILSPDLVPGAKISSVLCFPDWVFNIAITPNRPDCANVVGIAREIAAATGKPLKMPDIRMDESGPSIEELTSVTILDPDGCPRYAAGMIQGVKPGPSPFWMRYRLYQSEVRSISNLVDVTNYVMLETGQPLHAFDYDRLRENRIVVRRAEEGEVFTTLDGQSRTMCREDLMICDGEKAVALAGIMGGLNSEIFADTTNVLIESAFFDPVTIRRGSKRLALSTEASYRFERGADIEGVGSALRRALSLMCRLSGGRIAKGLVDNYPRPWNPPRIHLRTDHVNRILGTSLSRTAMKGYFEALEMGVRDGNEDELVVQPPSFRVDVTREADLTEEVARCYGFDRIPLTVPSIRPSEEGDSPELFLQNQINAIMTGIGFFEIITYSFISPESADILGAEEDSPIRSFVPLLNPLTVDQSVLRTSLIPGLMSVVKTNMVHDQKGLRLFEWGKIFVQDGEDRLPAEMIFIAGVMIGQYQEKSWYHDERACDYYDMKGAVEALLKGIGLHGIHFKRELGAPGYDNEILAGIYCSDRRIGRLGKVASNVMGTYDLEDKDAYVFELDVQPIPMLCLGARKFRPFPRFPAVFRDLSLLVERHIESARLVEIIRKEGGDLLESVQIFDLYEGEKIDPSEKAIAFRISYRSPHETLEGERINRLHGAIIEKIRKETGGRLREG